ncbi:hypothetical protein LOK49_LG07G03660 [Camellia lanceoleosa]|uniref:Uncharacterized protein n=1 Tax=Camellia lanceoleosa TaxID=1840588 RepID=A0ACC0H0G5_9ERIC|nr:hypothetical protein LOK49_LG07G03660 [Camellia lanceoleosa]
MTSQETTDLVTAYASDDGTTFRVNFARAMVRMSNLGVLSGSQGQVQFYLWTRVSFILKNLKVELYRTDVGFFGCCT